MSDYRITPSGSIHNCNDSPKCRPVVVIDPEGRDQVEGLVREFLSAHPAWGNWERVSEPVRANTTDAMQAALRSLIAPPKPEEPTGLGAVVEDAKGVRWVRNNPRGAAKWSRENAAADGLPRDYRAWRQLDVPSAEHVKSEGWSE